MSKISIDREVVEQALEALEWDADYDTSVILQKASIAALRAALEQLQEPSQAPCSAAEDGVCEALECCQRREPVQEPHNLINLPILPEPAWNERVYGGHGNEITYHWYSDHQMREYARQAVLEAEDAWQSRHPTPQSVELTDEDIAKAWATTKGDVLYRIRPFARAVIAAYRAKQEGKT